MKASSPDILFISTNDWVPWGGSEVLWSQSALLLKKLHPEKHIAACVKEWNPVPRHIDELSRAGVEIIYKKNRRLPAYQRYANRLLPTAKQFRHSQFYQELINRRPQLVIFSLGDHNEAFDLIEEFRKAGIRYALNIQLAKDAQIASDDYHNTIRDNYVGAARVYFVSNQNKRILETQLAQNLANAEVISNPFPFLNNASDVRYPATDNGFHLAFVASLSANHKGQDMLFEVMADKKWKNRELTVNLYGKGPHAQYLRDLKKFYGLERINFAGFADSVDKIWSANHAAILCSRMEGQSLALLEAMSYNRMPIVTDVGDARELIDHGVNGFVAEAPTVKHIDEALEAAWQKRAQWKEMGARAGDKLRSLRQEDPVKVFAEKITTLLNT